MIDWTKQTEDLLQTWTDTQKKAWSGWTDAAQQAGQAQVAETWRQAVDTWAGAVTSGLDAQLELSRTVSDNVGAVPGLPKDLVDWAGQTRQLGVRWNEAQRQLWESYFGMIRKAVPTKMLGTIDNENTKLFATWQDSVEKIVEAQASWSKHWTDQAAPAAGSTSKKKSAPAA